RVRFSRILLEVTAPAVAARWVQAGKSGNDVGAQVGVLPAKPTRDLARVSFGLLEADDVRCRAADGLEDPVEVDDRAAVLHVEGHHLEAHRLRRGGERRGCQQPRARGGETAEEQDAQPSHSGAGEPGSRKGRPPFMTVSTFWRTAMSSRGSPGTAMRSPM